MTEFIPSLSTSSSVSLFWFRRDLRLTDNAGLYHALKRDTPVLPLFIFDKTILDELKDKKARRVEFIYLQIQAMKAQLESMGSSLLVLYGKPEKLYQQLFEQMTVEAIYTNRDYEPYAKERDARIAALCKQEAISFLDFKDQVIFDRDEIQKNSGGPYSVYTPYKKKWLAKLNIEETDFFVRAYPTEKYTENYVAIDPLDMPTLGDMGFEPCEDSFPEQKVSDTLLEKYGEQRDYPAEEGTSQLSVHFRFGTVSIREKAVRGLEHSDVWLSELIWRDFYQQVLDHWPHEATENYHKKYDQVRWENNEDHFKAWCEGRTGYPLVDAAMHQLNTINWMHNRLRMVTASFLTKHLLIDWRWGERYFAEKLLDYDMASNVGGWQWAAGTGVDASPYFRVFNPESQLKKFDPKKRFVKKWLPDYGTDAYPEPIVEHAWARERAIARFKEGLS